MPLLMTVFSAAAGMGLLLGLINMAIWLRLEGRREFLFAALMGLSAGCVALCEAQYLIATDTGAYQAALEIQNFAVGVMLISMVWFVNVRMAAGRVWLAWLITATWILCMLVNIASPGNLTFASLDAVERLTTVWGETYGVPKGTPEPWALLSNLATLAIIIFVGDATVTALRAGRTGVALSVGATILFFLFVAGIHTPLVDSGVIETPYMISLFFLAIALLLALGLVDHVARGAASARRLEIERRHWQTLLEEIDLAVLRIGPDGTLAYVNPYLENLCQRDAASVIGGPPSILISEDREGEIAELARSTGEWKSRARVPRSILAADGTTRDLVWFSTSLTDEKDRSDGFISFGQDVTEQLEAKAERDATLKEMEKMTRAITLGEMASTFAHELSQPIAAVLSSAQTLELRWHDGTERSDELAGILDRIIFNTRRARDLMGRVRSFMYDSDLDLTWFDFGDLLGDAIEMVCAEAQRANVTLTRIDADAPVMVNAARLELQQVLVNLLLNAIQATTASGNGQVAITWWQDSEGLMVVSVDDNGPGLDPKTNAAIFEPFFTSKETGTGIGLSVVHRIVTRHGGTIAVESGTLGGASFVLTLPIAEMPRLERYA